MASIGNRRNPSDLFQKANYFLRPTLANIGLTLEGATPNVFWALRRNLAERAIDGVFSDQGFSIDSAV
jgi:hypothetical protein